MVGSLYKQAVPLVNAARKPGEWSTYDVVWTAPRFNADGSLKTPAYATVFLNGVLVENHFALKGQTLYVGQPFYKAYGHRTHQAAGAWGQERTHQLRNIWIRDVKAWDVEPEQVSPETEYEKRDAQCASLFCLRGKCALRLTFAAARAVDVARRVAGVVGCELDVYAGEFGRLACSSQRVVLAEVDQVLLGGSTGDLERRPDGAGRDAVHADALGSKLL